MVSGRHERAPRGILFVRNALLIPIKLIVLYMSTPAQAHGRGGSMNPREIQSKRCKFVSSVEMLDDRLVLSALAPVPGTPSAAASPFGAAQVRKFERDLERVDHGFMAKSKHLKAYVTSRTDYLKTEFTRAAASAQEPVQQVSVTSNTSSSAGLGTRGKEVTGQVGQSGASFNTRSAFRPGVPANAIESSFQAARVGLRSSVNSVTSKLQTITTVVTSRGSSASSSVGNLGKAVASVSTTPSATTTTSSTTTGIGTITTQQFSNASTQAAGTINATINGVDATLQQALASVQTQATKNIASAITTFSNAPAGTFEPTVG
jgi:hypothetical protein